MTAAERKAVLESARTKVRDLSRNVLTADITDRPGLLALGKLAEDLTDELWDLVRAVPVPASDDTPTPQE